MTNKIQFQKGLSLEEFIKNFRNEKQCAEYLEKLRWGRGFLCSKCGGEHYTRNWKDKRLFYRCKSCRHRNALISGTMFENTKLPLTKWFLAIYLLTQTKKGASGVDLKRKLGVNKDTAWGMRQKILAVMKSREDEQMLDNQVQIDDVYYGGKLEGKSGRGSENKQAFLKQRFLALLKNI
jgi:transposase-like protein